MQHRSSRKQLEAGARTAAVPVKVVQRVEARLLLLVGLERVAGLQIGVLHDPAGPEGKGGEENHGSQPQTKTTRPLLMYFFTFCFSLKPIKQLKPTLAFQDAHKYLVTGWLTFDC